MPSATHDLKLNPLKGSGCWIRASAEDFGSCQEFVISNPGSLPNSLSGFASRTFTIGNKEKGNFFLDQRNILEILNFSIYNGYPSQPTEQSYPSRFLINRNISEFTERLSESMTNYIRMGPGSVRHSGSAFRDETFMIVDWPWFAYPAGCVLVAILYFTVAVTTRKKDGGVLWKSSCLPLVLYGIQHRTDRVDGVDQSLLGIETMARAIPARLHRNEDGEIRFLTANE